MTATQARLGAPTAEEFVARCLDDPELRIAVRHWTGGIRFTIGHHVIGFDVHEGELGSTVPESGDEGVISIEGPADLWAPLFLPTPPPFAQISVLVSMGDDGLRRSPTDPVLWWQYLPAVERAAELLREPGGRRSAAAVPAPGGSEDSPVGRYVHLQLDGLDHRIYYEEAGRGIPLLLQHTAGAQSLQWRHLFEMPEITDHFRLVAYDLPFHGKSVPPIERRWWEEEYRLTGSFVRQVPVALAGALGLDRPVFMGCSVGGLLALDLAAHHRDLFDAVISLEGALHIGGEWDQLIGMWHPKVSNHAKARLMEALCSPTSPEPYVKEVSQVYSAGWPPAFVGDLWYYMVDFDLRERAGEIDTTRVGVHILSGEYDWSGSVAHGRAAHEAIPGSTHVVMPGVGHFPMQENPQEFARHLLPVLREIRARR